MKLEGFNFDNPFVITKILRISQWYCKIEDHQLRITVNWNTKKIILKSSLFGRVISDFDSETLTFKMSFEQWIISEINKKLANDIPSARENLL